MGGIGRIGLITGKLRAKKLKGRKKIRHRIGRQPFGVDRLQPFGLGSSAKAAIGGDQDAGLTGHACVAKKGCQQSGISGIQTVLLDASNAADNICIGHSEQLEIGRAKKVGSQQGHCRAEECGIYSFVVIYSFVILPSSQQSICFTIASRRREHFIGSLKVNDHVDGLTSHLFNVTFRLSTGIPKKSRQCSFFSGFKDAAREKILLRANSCRDHCFS